MKFSWQGSRGNEAFRGCPLHANVNGLSFGLPKLESGLPSCTSRSKKMLGSYPIRLHLIFSFIFSTLDSQTKLNSLLFLKSTKDLLSSVPLLALFPTPRYNHTPKFNPLTKVLFKKLLHP